jgi:hypothetical protein
VTEFANLVVSCWVRSSTLQLVIIQRVPLSRPVSGSDVGFGVTAIQAVTNLRTSPILFLNSEFSVLGVNGHREGPGIRVGRNYDSPESVKKTTQGGSKHGKSLF